MSLANRLAELAATAEPPALDAAMSRRMLDHAIAEARAPRPEVVARSRWPWLVIPALAVVAVVVLLVVRRPDTTVGAPSHITLVTGDHLVGSPGARFDVEALTPAERRLRLRTGTLLVAVAATQPAQRFDVAVGELVVRASRSVFSVDTSTTTATIVVFHGDVQVVAPDATVDLRPGAIYRHDLVTRVAVAEPPPRPPAPPRAEPPAPPPAAPRVPVGERPRKQLTDKRRPADEPAAEDPVVDVSAATGDLSIAQAHVAARRYGEALEEATRATALTGDWQLVIGDAQRGLGHPSEAATAFEAAARAFRGAARAEAAYTAAYIRFRDLDQAAAALATLDAGGVDATDSPLEERGLALRTQILVALGRTDDAKARAAVYLDRFPKGGQSAAMRRLLAGN